MCIFQAQIRITDLVVDKLRIADTSIATLSENIVQGVSPGRTEIQVQIDMHHGKTENCRYHTQRRIGGLGPANLSLKAV